MQYEYVADRGILYIRAMRKDNINGMFQVTSQAPLIPMKLPITIK